MKKRFAFILTVLLLLYLFVGCISSFMSAMDTSVIQAPNTNSEVSAPATFITSKIDDSEVSSPMKVQEPASIGKMKVHFIDVGQGDAILIETPSKNVLIDGGNRGTTVVTYLKDQGLNSLDLVIATHAHADHSGGLINVFQSIPVKEVIDPGVVHTNKTFEDYLTLIDLKNIKFTVGQANMVRDFGDGTVMVIAHPSDPYGSPINDTSIVVRMTFGEISFLFTGDAERPSEEQILRQGYNLKSTVLKVGHHGSNTSTTASFINAIAPEVAIIMVGQGNRYGHPHDETLLRLTNAKIDIYRTDIHGTIIITANDQTFEVNQKQPYQYNPPKIPEPPIVPVSEYIPVTQHTQIQKIYINTASVEQLQEIIHIGPVRAQQIIKLRPFKSVDELTKVSGIGPVRLEDIKKEGKVSID
jgi:competence protein ComEC